MSRTGAPFRVGMLALGNGEHPVLCDTSLGTGQDGTVYLFFADRCEIRELPWSFVEPRLRPMTIDEVVLYERIREDYAGCLLYEVFVPRDWMSLFPPKEKIRRSDLGKARVRYVNQLFCRS